MRCCGSDCDATARHFNAAVAERDRQRYRSHGLDKRARRLVDGLLGAEIAGCSILDVGSGLGLPTLELLKRGAARATLADASSAYLDAARREAAACALADRVDVVLGDFVQTVDRIDAADIVVLDRTVCCYPAWQPLLEAAAARCRSVLGVTYPRNRPDVRLVIALENLRRRFKHDAFRAFVHSPAAMDLTLRRAGLHRISHAATFAWSIDIYARAVDGR